MPALHESMVVFFDCDDCLYFNNWRTAKFLTEKIEAYCISELGLAPGTAYELYKEHGTCLQGLIKEVEPPPSNSPLPSNGHLLRK